jgi:hypothetical protein
VKRPARVQLDLNVPDFQQQLFDLEEDDYMAVRATFVELLRLTWNEVYRDKGLRWELIRSRVTETDDGLYSIRLNRKFRAVVRRVDNIVRFIALAPDHDSTDE